MTRKSILKRRQDMLKKEILAILDSFLIGTIAKSPSMSGHNLTTKIKGKTVTKYARKAIVPKALEMAKKYDRIWSLIQRLSEVNWELLNIGNK